MSSRVAELYIYPIKSCAGIAVQKMKIGKTGAEWDRQWMIVDEKGQFMTQRKIKKLALIRTELKPLDDPKYLLLRIPEQGEFEIALKNENHETKPVRVWDSDLQGHEEDPSINQALSAFLGQQCSLVRYGSRSSRKLDFEEKDLHYEVAFADGFPFLLTNSESLRELNSRLGEPVPMSRFRANIVVQGQTPFEEDHWEKFKINAVNFQVSRGCARCTVITVDQNTGVSPSNEPLKTLATYRKVGSHVFFGQNLVHHNEGFISVGDLVELT